MRFKIGRAPNKAWLLDAGRFGQGALRVKHFLISSFFPVHARPSATLRERKSLGNLYKIMSKNNKIQTFILSLITIAGLLSVIAFYLKRIIKLLYSPSKLAPEHHIEQIELDPNNKLKHEPLLIKLSSKRTAVQLSTFLPQIHLTLVSVLQGFALSVLISQLEKEFPTSIQSVLLYIDSLLIIVLVWYLYSAVFVVFISPLSFWHTLLQFLLTIAESISFLSITNPGAWTIGMAMMLFVTAAIRFLNMKFANPNGYERKDIFDFDMMFERRASRLFFSMGVVFTAVGFIQLKQASYFLDIFVVISALLIILLLAFLSHKTNTFLIKLYFENTPWIYKNGQVFEKDTTP